VALDWLGVLMKKISDFSLLMHILEASKNSWRTCLIVRDLYYLERPLGCFHPQIVDVRPGILCHGENDL